MSVEIMTAKEFLRQYEDANRKALRCKTEYETELEKIDAIGSTLSNDAGMPHGSGISRRTEDKAIRLADKAMKWKVAELEAIEKRQEVFELICDVKGVEGDVLYEKYINLHKWEEVCVILNYSWGGVHKAHRRALAIVQNRLQKSALKCT